MRHLLLLLIFTSCFTLHTLWAQATADPNLDFKRPSPAGLGLAIGGGGILGLPLRLEANKNTFFEVGAHLRPVVAIRKNPRSFDLYPSLMFSGGLQIMQPMKYHQHINRYRANGFALHGGRSIGKKAVFGSIGFISERIRPRTKDRSFIFEIGAGWLYEPYKAEAPFFDDNLNSFMLYWKFHFNSFLKSKPKRKKE
jgi:hypothetical protein